MASHWINLWQPNGAVGYGFHFLQNSDAGMHRSGPCGEFRRSGTRLHVAKSGNNANAGTAESPFLAIGKAAETAQPGDTITVHGGTYREWVRPPHSG